MTRSHLGNSKKQYYWEQLTSYENTSEIPRSLERTRTEGAQKHTGPRHLVDTRIRRNNVITIIIIIIIIIIKIIIITIIIKTIIMAI